MSLSDDNRRYAALFMPYALKKRDAVEEANGKFVHYTSAETAMNIVRSERVWMRNAMVMNDFSEIAHGRNCLIPAYNKDEVGGRLRRLIDRLHPGSSSQLENLFNGWLPHFHRDTYLTSLSEHDPSENSLGRLSMWRAYCPKNGVALVLNNTPFMQETDALKAFSSPVAYLDARGFELQFLEQIQQLERRAAEVAEYPQDMLVGSLFTMLKFAMLCTKHPGFIEEREWRIIYSPTQDRSPVIEQDFVSLDGVPQEIHKIPLVNAPESGLLEADIPHLLDRIIIGPTPQPFPIWKTFVALLRSAGVPNPEERVVTSEIPLRTA